MMGFAVILALLVTALYAYRRQWMTQLQPRVITAAFEGRLYRAGETVIAVAEGKPGATRTVICFPGFMEDMRYFQSLYAEVDCQLILVNNADYHCPFDQEAVEVLDWEANPFPLGTIEYDGFHLARVVERMAPGQDILLHGHSRGGAVVLEAARQAPAVFKPEEGSVAAVLEAAVLPQAKTAGKGSEPLVHRLICFFLPIVLGHSRKADPSKMLEQPMMRPTNELKTALCQSIYFLPRHYATCVTNVHSIWQWQRDTGYEVYDNYAHISVLLGERDDVLDNRSMRASAERGAARNPGVTLIDTTNTNHFISLEQPEYILGVIS